MNPHSALRILFLVAAAYDGLLGLVFVLAPRAVFDWAGVTPPNHPGYVQFPALLLILFAWMFVNVARRPAANRHLIVYGMGLKLSYCGVIFYHWTTAGLPYLWKPFAVADLVFLLLFAWALALLGGPGRNVS